MFKIYREHSFKKSLLSKKACGLVALAFLVFCFAGFYFPLAFADVLPGQNFQLGVRAYQHHQYTMAIPYFQSALRQNPTDPNLYYYLAECYFKLKRFEEAQQAYQRAIGLAPYSDAAQLAEQALGQYTDSIQYRTKVISSNSSKSAGNKDDRLELTFNDDNYLSEMTDKGRFIRWSVLKQPVKIYVDERPTNVSHFQPQFVSNVKKSFEIWSKALDNQLRYQMVRTAADADIKVLWVDRLNSVGQANNGNISYQAGITTPYYEGGLLKQMTIELATLDLDGKPHNQSTLFPVTIHEMGHALGLLNHSDDKNDVMYPATTDNRVRLSNRDINTIRALYSKTVDMTNRPADEPATEEQQEAITSRLDNEIKTLEAKTKNGGDNLDWINLSSLYLNKADTLKAEGATGDVQDLYKKALSASSQAVNLEPEYGPAYANRAFILEQAGAIDKAFEDSKKALKYAPREQLNWEQQAILLTKLGRKTEAKNIIDQMFVKFPESKNKDTVKRLKQQLS